MAGNMDELLFSPQNSDASMSPSAIVRFNNPKIFLKKAPAQNNYCVALKPFYFTI